MELTSNISESLSLTAESTTKPQEGKKDAAGKPTEDTSADVSVSVRSRRRREQSARASSRRRSADVQRARASTRCAPCACSPA
jgi:hypothetical protein